MNDFNKNKYKTYNNFFFKLDESQIFYKCLFKKLIHNSIFLLFIKIKHIFTVPYFETHIQYFITKVLKLKFENIVEIQFYKDAHKNQ